MLQFPKIKIDTYLLMPELIVAGVQWLMSLLIPIFYEAAQHDFPE